MRMDIHWFRFWSIICLFSVLEFFYTAVAQANILRRYIRLNTNGTIASSSELPSCNSGDRISLLSYKYLFCYPGNQCIRREYNLSQAAEVLIHQMCSSRDTCISRSLPSNDLSVGKVNTLQVEYKCLDHFETFLDLCVDTTKTLDNTVHLVTSETLRTSQECRCSFRGEEFTVVLKDIRLLADDKNRCSPAKIQIPFRQITCNNQSNNYGSVFDKVAEELTTMSNVRIQTYSTELLPQMVWIIIQPKGSLRVTCESTPWEVEKTSTIDYTTISQNSSSDSNTLNSSPVTERDNDSADRHEKATAAGIAIGVCMCIGVAGGAFFLWHRFGLCKTKTRESIFELEDKQRSGPETDTEDVTEITHDESWKEDAATPMLNKNNILCVVTKVLQDVNDTETSLDFKIKRIMDEVVCINPTILYKVVCINTKIKRKQKYQEAYDAINEVIITRRLHKPVVFPV